MSHLYVSLVVSDNSDIIHNELLRVEKSFSTAEEAETYLLAIETWMADIPTPGSEKKTIETTEDLVFTDNASVLASHLGRIITRRDPRIFPEYYFDPEAEAAAIERRPYDAANIGG